MNIWQEGGTVTVLGLLVVFVCLALIILLITVMTAVMRKREKPKPETRIEKAEEKIEEAIHKPLPAVPVVEVEQNPLVAAISAAVAAYMADESSAASLGYAIRSVRRMRSDSEWRRAGRRAQIFNKL